MEISEQKKIVEGMLAFQPTVRFAAGRDPSAAVRAAIDSCPKLAYYLRSYSISSMMGVHEVKVQYHHQEVKPDDIHTVGTKEECLRLICQAIGNYKKQLILAVPNTVDMKAVFHEFREKHETFYANFMQWQYRSYSYGGRHSLYEIGFGYRIGQVKLNMMEQEVDAEVERIGKLLFLPGMPPEAKVYLAHNYLTVNVDYVDSDKNPLDTSYTQSAYGALIRHACVCQGFAEAFKRLMDYAGVGCDVVCGQVVGSDGYHAWNIVSLGREPGYYHVDVTWDASGERTRYVHFCKKDGHYEGKRIWNRELTPKCAGGCAVLSIARTYIFNNKQQLLSRGVDSRVLDC